MYEIKIKSFEKDDKGKCILCEKEYNKETDFKKIKIKNYKINICHICLIQLLSEKNIKHLRKACSQ